MTWRYQYRPTSADSAGIEFCCEGCGWRVYLLGLFVVPSHGFCATCALLCELYPNPEDMLRVRRHIFADAGG